LADVRPTLVEYVKQFAAPLFMLFEFASFNDSVYTDIVRARHCNQEAAAQRQLRTTEANPTAGSSEGIHVPRAS